MAMLAVRTLYGHINLHSTIDLGQVAIGDHLWWLIANADLETRWAPVDELDGALGLESCNSIVYIIWDNITTVEQASGHIFPIARVTLHHLVVWFEARHGDLLDRVGFMLCLSCRDNRCVGNEREVDTRIWDQVGLKFGKIDVEGTIETERGGD